MHIGTKDLHLGPLDGREGCTQGGRGRGGKENSVQLLQRVVAGNRGLLRCWKRKGFPLAPSGEVSGGMARWTRSNREEAGLLMLQTL
jgi:hypothetical protein